MKKVSSIELNTQLLLLAVPLCVAVSFASTLRSMFERWTRFDEAYGHGLLIVGIFFFLLLEKRNHLATLPCRPAPWALPMLALASLAWLAAHAASISLLQELLLPPILLLAWLAVCGRQVTRALLFPVLFLYFAIPVWDYLNDTLVNLTVLAVQAPLPLLHITTLVEGNAIHIAAGTVYIADGCSGLRYLITGTALATLAAWLNFGTWRSRLAIVASGIGLSLLANWIRVFSLVLIAHFTQMQSPLIREHDHFGWLVFLVVISPIFIASWMASSPSGKQRPAPSPLRSFNTTRPHQLLAAILALVCGPLLALTLTAGTSDDVEPHITIPARWIEASRHNTEWQPSLPQAHRVQQKTLLRAGSSMGVSVHVYRKDREHPKLLPYIASLYDKDRWTLLASQPATETAFDGDMTVNQLNLKSTRSDERYMVWYWFEVGGQVTASYAYAKLLQIPALLERENHALVTVLWSRCRDVRCNDAQSVLREVLANAEINSLKRSGS